MTENNNFTLDPSLIFPEKKNNYTYLKYGDILPTVGVLQKLLNRAGAQLKADGIFGVQTETAVLMFQEERRLRGTGIVDKQTWDRIVGQANLPILDCLDFFEDPHRKNTAEDINKVAKGYIAMGGASNGVGQAIANIRLAAHKKLFLLRFHGHGGPGGVGIAFGHGFYPKIKFSGWGQYANIDLNNIENLVPTLTALRPAFGRYGHIQLMHCKPAEGSKGRSFIKRLADIWNVPVTAGIQNQFSGGGLPTFIFEGPTFTACPQDMSLSEWCRSLPDFPPISVY